MPPDPAMCINNKDLQLWRILLVRLNQMSSEIAVNSRMGPAQFLEVDTDSPVWNTLIEKIETIKSIKVIDNKELAHNEAFLYRQITDAEIERAYKEGLPSDFDVRNSGRRIIFETL